MDTITKEDIKLILKKVRLCSKYDMFFLIFEACFEGSRWQVQQSLIYSYLFLLITYVKEDILSMTLVCLPIMDEFQ